MTLNTFATFFCRVLDIAMGDGGLVINKPDKTRIIFFMIYNVVGEM